MEVKDLIHNVANNVVDNIGDDKNLVIFAATAIGICSLFLIPDPKEIVSSIITGLFGIAVGRGSR